MSNDDPFAALRSLSSPSIATPLREIPPRVSAAEPRTHDDYRKAGVRFYPPGDLHDWILQYRNRPMISGRYPSVSEVVTWLCSVARERLEADGLPTMPDSGTQRSTRG